jgi:DNA-3-methyladenine glycosylase I
MTTYCEVAIDHPYHGPYHDREYGYPIRDDRELFETHGSFAGWLDAHHPLAHGEWQRLFKRTFKFTGGEIVGEFLISTGYLPGAHHPACPIYPLVLGRAPPWSVPARSARSG